MRYCGSLGTITTSGQDAHRLCTIKTVPSLWFLGLVMLGRLCELCLLSGLVINILLHSCDPRQPQQAPATIQAPVRDVNSWCPTVCRVTGILCLVGWVQYIYIWNMLFSSWGGFLEWNFMVSQWCTWTTQKFGILCGPRTGASQITSDSCSYGHSKGTLKILNHDFIFSNENLVNRKYA